MTSSIPVFVVSMTLAFAGCKKKEPEPTSLPLASAALQASSAKPLAPPTPGPVASLAVTWTDPAGWVRKPSPNNVRRATYSIPPQVGDSPGAELGVFYFGPGEGGGLEANIQRWIKQFPDAAPSAIHDKPPPARDHRVGQRSAHRQCPFKCLSARASLAIARK